MGLISLGKKVRVLSCDGVPSRYQFLPHSGLINTRYSSNGIDLAVAVDCGSPDRLGPALRYFDAAKRILQIDHHEYGEAFGDVTLIEKDTTAVGELIYRLLNELGVEITKDIAMCILTSIIVETGSFRFPNLKSDTFQICAELLKHKVNFLNLIENVYWKSSIQKAKLIGACIARAKSRAGGKLLWTSANKNDYEKFGSKESDLDGVTDELRAIDGVEVAVMFRERRTNRLRVGLRSRGKVNVAKIAQDFGGGGHFDTAGCVIQKRKMPQFLEAVTRAAKRVQ
ncbi:MAG: DHH family phosphoesterase [Candidatus Omnitrophica bacterium]|nr:DHH family phosphoesterase [Candidatus Omnitrophota bacterium]